MGDAWSLPERERKYFCQGLVTQGDALGLALPGLSHFAPAGLSIWPTVSADGASGPAAQGHNFFTDFLQFLDNSPAESQRMCVVAVL
jgi:hypothetical protein